MQGFEELLALFSVLLLLGLGFGVGKLLESHHYRSIRKRERGFLPVPAVTMRTVGDDRPVREARLAVGSVVVSVDYYKRFLMGFRMIFGGESRAYAPLIDRGRREAVLRMKESCPGANLFLNCRLQTSAINEGQPKGLGTVEVLAYGTAVWFQQ